MGDICEIDADGYLSVTGRTSDFILRGGKNISASQVEDAVMTHPAIAVAAAVAMPDPIFGEKVCLYTELVDAGTIKALDLPELVEHLLGLGVSKARTTHRGRRATPIVRRKDRQRRTPRGYQNKDDIRSKDGG
jgi:acyl-CoA synthetase